MKNIYTLLLMILLFSSCWMTQKASSLYDIKLGDQQKNILFLIDISGSMQGKVETNLKGTIVASARKNAANKAGNAAGNAGKSVFGKRVGGVIGRTTNKELDDASTKLGQARNRIIKLINSFGSDRNFNVVTFENKVKTWKKELKIANSGNKNQAKFYLKKLDASGGTNMYDGLKKCFDISEISLSDINAESKVDVIFLLSDGAPTTGAYTRESDILNQLNNLNQNQKVIVNTIGLGPDQNESLLSNIADQNGGVYIREEGS